MVRGVLASLVALVLILPAVAGAPGVFMTPVLYTEDAAVWLDLELASAELVYLDVAGDDVFQSADTLILHLGASGTLIEVGDLILSGADAGKRVTTSHTALNGEPFEIESSGVALADLIKFRDVTPTTPDGVMGIGDGLYLDSDGDDKVSVNDVRLVAHAGRAFGSVATASDSDVTAASALLPGPFTLTFTFADAIRGHDLTGNGLTADDPVYFDVDGNNLANAGDVRWSAFRTQKAGQWIAWSDLDAVSVLLDVPGPEVLTTGNTGPVLLSSGGNVGASDIGDLSVASHADCAFRKVLALATDCAPSSGSYGASTDFEVRYLESGHASGYDAQDTLYLHIDTVTNGNVVSLGDVRLTPFLSFAAGTRVVTTDGDRTLGTLALPGTFMFLDVDGNGIPSAGDMYYIDIDDDGLVTAGDLRFTKISNALNAGQHVTSANADREPVLRAVTGSGLIEYFDAFGTTFHIEDPVVLQVVSTSAGTFDAFDIHISAAPDRAAGTFVQDGGHVDGKAATATPAIKFVYVDVDSSSSYTSGDWLYASASTVDKVEIKDVRLSTVHGLAPGTRVTASHQDRGLDTEPLTGAEVRFDDRNGNGRIDVGDIVYLNVDEVAETGSVPHLVSRLDVRLVGSGGTSTVGNPAAPAPPPTTTTTTSTSSSPSATVTVTATATSTASATDTETDTDTDTDTDTGGTGGTGGTNGTGGTGGGNNQTPGLGSVAVLGILAAALLVVRRRL